MKTYDLEENKLGLVSLREDPPQSDDDDNPNGGGG